MLATQADTIERISVACGFGNANSAKRAFKATFGISMKDYRQGIVIPKPANPPFISPATS